MSTTSAAPPPTGTIPSPISNREFYKKPADSPRWWGDISVVLIGQPSIRVSAREGESRVVSTLVAPYCLTAIAEISIFAPPINPATWTVALAGLGSGMSAL